MGKIEIVSLVNPKLDFFSGSHNGVVWWTRRRTNEAVATGSIPGLAHLYADIPDCAELVDVFICGYNFNIVQAV